MNQPFYIPASWFRRMSGAIQSPGATLAPEREVEIDRSRTAERYRWACPNGHINWCRTNAHIWCQTCRRQNEAGHDVDPEHYHLLDKKHDELVPYGQVRLAEDELQ